MGGTHGSTHRLSHLRFPYGALSSRRQVCGRPHASQGRGESTERALDTTTPGQPRAVSLLPAVCAVFFQTGHDSGQGHQRLARGNRQSSVTVYATFIEATQFSTRWWWRASLQSRTPSTTAPFGGGRGGRCRGAGSQRGGLDGRESLPVRSMAARLTSSTASRNSTTVARRFSTRLDGRARKSMAERRFLLLAVTVSSLQTVQGYRTLLGNISVTLAPTTQTTRPHLTDSANKAVSGCQRMLLCFLFTYLSKEL